MFAVLEHLLVHMGCMLEFSHTPKHKNSLNSNKQTDLFLLILQKKVVHLPHHYVTLKSSCTWTNLIGHRWHDWLWPHAWPQHASWRNLPTYNGHHVKASLFEADFMDSLVGPPTSSKDHSLIIIQSVNGPFSNWSLTFLISHSIVTAVKRILSYCYKTILFHL